MSSFYYGSWLLRYFPKARLSFSVPICLLWASLVAQMVKNLLPTWETWVWVPGQEDPLEKGVAPPTLHAIYTSDPWVLVQVSSVPWAQLCLTLGDFGAHHAPVHGIFQARLLEGVAISYSGGSPKDQAVLLAPPVLAACAWALLRLGSCFPLRLFERKSTQLNVKPQVKTLGL